MSLSILHRGCTLTQQQVDALIPLLNDGMRSRRMPKGAAFDAAVDKALEAAGCPLTDEQLAAAKEPRHD